MNFLRVTLLLVLSLPVMLGQEAVEENLRVQARASSVLVPRVTVRGEVRAAGPIEWEEKMTLGIAIEMAGGVTTDGDLSNVRLHRNGKNSIYNLLLIEENRELAVYQSDVIEVVKKKSRAETWTIGISVTNVPLLESARIDNAYPVSEKGTIKLWKVGEILVRGKTMEGISMEITTAYKEAGIYDDPIFKAMYHTGTVVVPMVTVGGEVRGAGPMAWEKKMTLGSAIKKAGGLTPYGDPEWVKLYRKGKVYNFELKKHQEVRLYNSDVIEVVKKDSDPEPSPKRREGC